jgi:hypothetical protein
MQSKTTLEAPPAAPAQDDALLRALPSVVVGETAEVERTHEWPGTMFVVLSYVVAVGLAASAVGSAGWALLSDQPALGLWAAGAGAWSVLQWRLATAVQRFSRWGWYGAMAELGAAAAAKVWTFASTGDVVGPVIGLAIDVAWMSYFWERREQFDVDVEL